MADLIFNIAGDEAAKGGLNWDSGTYRLALLQALGTIDGDEDDLAEVLTAGTELTATGYTQGHGNRILVHSSGTPNNRAVNIDDPNDEVELDVDDTPTGNIDHATNQVVGAVLYKEGAADGSSKPLRLIDINPDISIVNPTNITFQWHADGAITIDSNVTTP